MARHQNSCLLVLDMQNDLVHPEGKLGKAGLGEFIAENGILERTASVIAAMRAAGRPVGYVRVAFKADNSDVISRHPRVKTMRDMGALTDGEWGGAIHDSVAPEAGDPIFTKQSVNPFVSTNIGNWLFRHGIGEIVLAGVATNQVVEATARHADDIGLLATVLEDCCASPKKEMHDFVIANVIPTVGRAISAEAFTGELKA
ncbi:MAG: isochorismatase family cysteine hydrolase [Flavobacteriaceae bacterium]